MSYRRGKNLDKNLIFAEYFNSEQEVRRNGGVPTDVTFDKGVAEFNGSSSDVFYNRPILRGAGEFSLRVKVKINTDVANDGILVSRSSILSGIFINNSNQINTRINNQANLTYDFSIDQWYDIVMTYSVSSNVSILYINGVEEDNANALTVLSDGAEWYVGQDPAGGRFVDGDIPLVEFYNKALTAEEVSNLYNDARYVMPQLNRTDLSQILHVTARSGVILNTLSGDTIDGEIVDEVALISTDVFKDGQVKVMLFDDGFIDCGDYLGDLTGDVSILGWIKPNYNLGTFDRIISNGTFEIIYRDQSPSAEGKRLYVVSDGVAAKYTANDVVVLNEWLHFILVRKVNGDATFYINGEISGTEDETSGTPGAPTGNMFIGKDADSSTKDYDGIMDGIIMLEGLLTSQEASQAYTSQKHLYP